MRGRSLARRFRGSFSATRCVALPKRTGRARVSGRTLGGLPPNVLNRNQRGWHQRTLIVFAMTCWQKRTFCAAAHAVECTFAREPPGAFSVPCKAFTRVSRLG